MSTVETKSAILESIKEMDREKTEKVFDYIMNLESDDQIEEGYERFKERAMREISEALNTEQHFD